MSLEFHAQSVISARRDFRREELQRFGSELSWLTDHSLIPEGAADYYGNIDPGLTDAYFGLGEWMVDQFARWSVEGHARLSLAETFVRHELTNEERVSVRESIRGESHRAYSPGIHAMAEIHAVVPLVASREGIDDPAEWARIAYNARRFGAQFARDGTEVQALVRHYLDGRITPDFHLVQYDPAKLVLDQANGLETVTPMDTILVAARELAEENERRIKPVGSCIALQVASEGLGKRSVYDLAWDAFGSACARLIYPKIAEEGIGPANVIGPIDENVRENIAAIQQSLFLKAETHIPDISSILSAILESRT